MNPLFQMMQNQNLMSNNIIARFNQFRQSFRGDARQQIQQMLNSGQITQDQYNQAVQMAQTMAEFASNPIQLVEPNQSILLDTIIPCNKGYVYHRNQSGIIILRGIVNCPNACFARYQVTFNGNIALAEAATVGPIAIGLAIDGEAIQTSRAVVTPAAVGDYFNVTSTAIITVPRGCCFNVAVQNLSAPAAGGGVAPEINVQNANLVVSRIA